VAAASFPVAAVTLTLVATVLVVAGGGPSDEERPSARG
jgi:hypothetical protein